MHMPMIVAGAMLVGLAVEPWAAAPDIPPEHQWVADLLERGEGRTKLEVREVEALPEGAEVIVDLQYPDTGYQPRVGQAKLFLPTALRDHPDHRVPLIHVAGYELDRSGGQGLLKLGVIISTPHGDEPNPIVRGENLDVAILHRVRALPCVDDAKVAVLGGSAGGYMTLMLAAETFPLVLAQPDCPPINLGYNCAYIVLNKPLAERQPPGQDHVNMPILLAVSGIGEGATAVYGSDYASGAWLNASPVVRMAEITCPTLITASTADLLVPINQYGAELIRPHNPAAFPQGFTMDMERLLSRPEARLTLLGVVPPEEIEVFVVPAPDDAPKLGWNGQPASSHVPQVALPFSTTRHLSLVVLDEGPPEPQVGHLKRLVGLNKDAFNATCFARPIGPEQLTAAKLRRLMLRFMGREAYPQEVTRGGAATILNRLDFPEAEQADVVRALRTFCTGQGCPERLQQLYRELPPDLRALGGDLADRPLEEMVAYLRALRL